MILMPCFRCSTRQTDPVRGSSPWTRAVVAGEQVLVCPTCQLIPDWTGDLDRCRRCDSVRLVKALGSVLCRECGNRSDGGRPAESPDRAGRADRPWSGGSGDSGGMDGSTGDTDRQRGVGPRPGLAADVEAALARVLGRSSTPGHAGTDRSASAPDRPEMPLGEVVRYRGDQPE